MGNFNGSQEKASGMCELTGYTIGEKYFPKGEC